MFYPPQLSRYAFNPDETYCSEMEFSRIVDLIKSAAKDFEINSLESNLLVIERKYRLPNEFFGNDKLVRWKFGF